jgi:hypothetical protein
LIGQVKREWQDTAYVLSYFGHDAKKRYLDFVRGGIARGRRPELVGGGLIRSVGGWFEVLSLRRSGQRQASGQRVLGDGEFVKQIISEMDELGRENLRLDSYRVDLSHLAERVCEVHNVWLGELRSGSRRREIAEARRVLSWLAVKEFGFSGAEVARYLGVTSSCVTRAVSTGNAPKGDRYL